MLPRPYYSFNAPICFLCHRCLCCLLSLWLIFPWSFLQLHCFVSRVFCVVWFHWDASAVSSRHSTTFSNRKNANKNALCRRSSRTLWLQQHIHSTNIVNYTTESKLSIHHILSYSYGWGPPSSPRDPRCIWGSKQIALMLQRRLVTPLQRVHTPPRMCLLSLSPFLQRVISLLRLSGAKAVLTPSLYPVVSSTT